MTQAQPKIGVVLEKIHLKSINITNAQVNTAQGLTSESWDKVEYSVNTNSHFFKDSKANKITISTTFKKEGDQGESLISANFTIEFDFEVDNIEDFRSYPTEQNSESEPIVHIHKDLGIALMGIAYSTARGIVLTRTAGTVLDGIILPVIDPESILE